MLGYLSADIICSEKRTVFRERSSRKTVSFEEQIMPKDKYPSLFFSQASERAGCLNPRIWLANLTHVTGPAFYDTAQGPDFFPPPAPLPKFRS